MIEEHFLPIPAHPGYYISNTGRVRKNTRTYPALFKLPSGAVVVTITTEGVQRRHRVSRLVYAAFMGDIEGVDIAHKDGNKSNCSSDNLQVVPRSARVDAAHRAKNAG